MYLSVYIAIETCSTAVFPQKNWVVGFGLIVYFLAHTFYHHVEVIVMSQSDYTDIDNNMGVKYTSII